MEEGDQKSELSDFSIGDRARLIYEAGKTRYEDADTFPRVQGAAVGAYAALATGVVETGARMVSAYRYLEGKDYDQNDSDHGETEDLLESND